MPLTQLKLPDVPSVLGAEGVLPVAGVLPCGALLLELPPQAEIKMLIAIAAPNMSAIRHCFNIIPPTKSEKSRSPPLPSWFCGGLARPHPGDDLSESGSFLDREEHSFGVQRHPGRGGLFRLEKERLLTKGSAHTD